MSDPEEGWPSIPDAEMDAFYQTADQFLNAANDLLASEQPATAGAAFLYACARYNGFAMQVQLDTAVIDEATREKLCDFFESEISEHLLQRLSNAPAPVGGQATGQALDVLIGMNGMDPDARSAFLKLGDVFIHIANDLAETVLIARISAAFLHACTRFNAYLLQREGLEPGVQDTQLIADFRQVYSDLLSFHLDQSLVAQPEP